MEGVGCRMVTGGFHPHPRGLDVAFSPRPRPCVVLSAVGALWRPVGRAVLDRQPDHAGTRIRCTLKPMRPVAKSRAKSEFRRKNAAALLAAAWALPSAALAGFFAMQLDAWSVPSGTLLVLGSPAIVLLDRVLVWGWAFAFFAERVSPVRLALLGVLLDLMLPLDRVSYHASPQFLFAEALAVGLILLPAQLFARWTRERSHLIARNLMHLCFHSALLLG